MTLRQHTQDALSELGMLCLDLEARGLSGEAQLVRLHLEAIERIVAPALELEDRREQQRERIRRLPETRPTRTRPTRKRLRAISGGLS